VREETCGLLPTAFERMQSFSRSSQRDSGFSLRILIPGPWSDRCRRAIMLSVEEAMAQILIRNVDESTKERLRRRARKNRRSMEAEVRDILHVALHEKEVPKRGLGSEIVALFSGQGIGLKRGEEIREWRGYPLKPIKFDE
jgi:antitoxin FitA